MASRSKNISRRGPRNRRSLRYATPDFLLRLVALMSFMRLSLTKAAHVALSGAAKQEIRVRFGRDDKGEGDGSIKSGCWTEAFFITLGGPQAHGYSVEKHFHERSAELRSLDFPGFPVDSCGFGQLHVVLFRENHTGTLGMTKARDGFPLGIGCMDPRSQKRDPTARRDRLGHPRFHLRGSQRSGRSFHGERLLVQQRQPDFVRLTLSSKQSQKTLGITVRDALFVCGTYRQLIEKRTCFRHRRVGVVGREHDPIDAHLKQQIEKGRREVEAAKRVVDIFSKIFADGAFGLRHGHRHHVEPLQHEGKGFAHVTDDDLQFWILVEYSAENHANDVDRGFDVPTPARAGKQLGYDRCKPSIGCVDHSLGRRSWMEVNGEVQQLSLFKNRPEKLVIEITSAVVPIDDRASEAVVSDHALQLFGGKIRSCGW